MLGEETIQIIKDFCEFIGKRGDHYQDWCVGVSSDAVKLLFEEMGMARSCEHYIIRRATTGLDALAVATAFWNIQCDKSSQCAERSDRDAVFIFAYRKSWVGPALSDKAGDAAKWKNAAKSF